MSNQYDIPTGWTETPLEHTATPVGVLRRRLVNLRNVEERLTKQIKQANDAQIELDKVVTSIAATEAAVKELTGLATIECPACHEELPKVARFCSDCGYELGK